MRLSVSATIVVSFCVAVAGCGGGDEPAKSSAESGGKRRGSNVSFHPARSVAARMVGLRSPKASLPHPTALRHGVSQLRVFG